MSWDATICHDELSAPEVIEICPKCGGEDTYRAHADATASHPEVWYWNCEDCLIQWGHE